MYHHFDGKKELPAESLRRDGAALPRATGELRGTARSPVQPVLDYLASPREALKGCTLGRMTQDPGRLLAPISPRASPTASPAPPHRCWLSGSPMTRC